MISLTKHWGEIFDPSGSNISQFKRYRYKGVTCYLEKKCTYQIVIQ